MPESDPDQERLRLAIERWFDAVDRGEEPDLGSLCGGDPALAARLERLLADEHHTVSVLRGGRDSIRGFRVISLLGEGGMGRVFLAEQESLKRLVALKVLDDRSLGDQSARTRFRREAEIAAQLDHPNIVPVYALDADGDSMFIAMKWLTGPALDAIDEPLSPGEVARIGIAIARALHHAHAAGVVHRDVKPANIILDDGQPFIVDFGLARADSNVTLTRSGVVAGTLAYLAPERLGGGASPDARSDLYSLGATLYEVASGRPPFPEAEPERLVHAILLQEAAQLRLPGAHRDLETIILRALDKDPSRRFQTGDELADELERYRRGDPIRSRPSGLVARSWTRVRRRPRLAATLATLATTAIVFCGLLLVDQHRAKVAFETRVTQANAALARRDFAAGRAAIDSLVAERPSDSDARALATRLRALDAIEDLLDLVLDRCGTNESAFTRTVTRIAETGAADVEPRGVGLALALADVYRGDSAAAVARVDAIEHSRSTSGGRGRDTVAVRAAAIGGEVPTSTDLPARSADEHVFAATAMRWLRKSDAEQEREIRAALELDRTHYRAQLALALFLAASGRHEAAEGALRTLRRPGRAGPVHAKNLARLCLIRGDADGALREIDTIAPEDRDPVTILFTIAAHERSGREKEARAMLESAIAQSPAAPEILTHAGLAAYAQGKKAEAAGLFREVADRAVFVETREVAASLLFFTRLDAVWGAVESRPSAPLASAKESLLCELRDEALKFAERARHPSARSRALAAAACAANVLGDVVQALGSLERAISIDGENAFARCLFVSLAVDRARDLPQSSSELQPLLEAADRHARDVCDAENKGIDPPRRFQVDEAWVARAIIASLLGDKPRCRIEARRALDRLGPEHVRAADLESLLAWASR